MRRTTRYKQNQKKSPRRRQRIDLEHCDVHQQGEEDENNNGKGPKRNKFKASTNNGGLSSAFKMVIIAISRQVGGGLKPRFRGSSRQRTRTTRASFVCGIFIGILVISSCALSQRSGFRKILKNTAGAVGGKTHSSEAGEVQILLKQYYGDSMSFSPMPKYTRTSENTPDPDYGGLDITFLAENEKRNSQADPFSMKGHVWSAKEKRKDRWSWQEYYAFDDDVETNKRFEEFHTSCRRVSWHKNYFPTCNTFHEIEIIKGNNKFIGNGSFRDAFLQQEPFDANLVMKLNRFEDGPFKYYTYEEIRMDAMVMELLTASPRITDIYGHCATSIYSEYLPREAKKLMLPHGEVGEEVNDAKDVLSQNSLTMSEKLDMALEMSEAIADLTGYKDGVLIHGDLGSDQMLFTPDGRLKLNDFNKAEAMLFDEVDGTYCRFKEGKPPGYHESPEQYKDERLDEKMDVWGLGNDIYRLITGLHVFYHVRSKKIKYHQNKRIIQDMIVNGETAYLDPRFRGKNYIQDKLIEVMEQCWIYKPDERIDVFGVITILRNALKESKKLGIYRGKF